MTRNYNAKGTRGRPTVAETYYGCRGAEQTAKACYGGQLLNNPSSDRTHAARVYASIGAKMLEPYTEQFPELENILPPRDALGSKRTVAKGGILEQLGRMKHQNNLKDSDILYAALLAVDAKERGLSSKAIEQALRQIRLDGGFDDE